MSLHPAVAGCRAGVRRLLSGDAVQSRAAAVDGPATVIVACSGGADSLALLSAAIFEGHKASLRIVGATVDHGLQPGSASHAADVVSQMRSMGVDESVLATVTVASAGLGQEAAAREARYDVLTQLADHLGASLVLLGHTLDDQAETVLLGLTRGSGARSLQGMRRSFDGFARPLLDLTRAETELACRAEGIDWWVDPHNTDARFTRARVRMEVMPMLEEQLGPGVAQALARTADQLQSDVGYLDEAASATYVELTARDQDAPGMAIPALAGLPDALRRRVLRLAALDAGAVDAELFYEHVLAIDELVTGWHGQKGIDLPGHLRALRRDGRMLFEPSRR